MRNMALLLGAVLWIGTLSPEIFVNPASGCIFDSDGNELGREEAREFMEAYFYGGRDGGQAEPELKFKFAVMEIFEKIKWS